MKLSALSPAHFGPVWRRAAALVALCVVLAMLAASAPLHAALLYFLAVAEASIQHHPILGASLFIVFAAVSAMFAFVSAALLMPIAVYTWGEVLSGLLLWSGWILGGVCAYGIGRQFGRPVVRWLTADAALQRLEASLRANTSFGRVLLLQFALPSELPAYLLGLTRYPLSKYLVALAIAELPYAFVTAYLGAGFVERQSGVILLLGVALVTVSVTALLVLNRRLRIDS